MTAMTRIIVGSPKPMLRFLLKMIFKIALVGNPNVGKSVLFGYLTGRYVNVANYPGTTVEVARGQMILDQKPLQLIDTPGINSLLPLSEDEQVTRDILLGGVDQVIQVADAKNLSRALLISLQLAELEIPFLLDLNMDDEAKSLGIAIDKKCLSERLGVPVVSTVAIQKRGLRELRQQCLGLLPASVALRYSKEIETAIAEILPFLKNPRGKRALALMILAGDKTLIPWLHEQMTAATLDQLEKIRTGLIQRHGNLISYRIHRERMKYVNTLVKQVMTKKPAGGTGALTRLGALTMHPLWGIFVLVAVLYGFYQFVGHFGAQIAVDWFENVLFGTYLNPWFIKLCNAVFSFAPFLTDLLVGEYGIITMALTYAFAIIFPIVTTFFIAFSIIEDSGYLPRLSIMLNRIFKLIGLNGKAVVPMVLGLGCDTMATMSARIMDTKKERILLTLLLALGVPCSAQLGIILGMLGSLPFWVTVLWGATITGVLMLVGFLAARLLPGESSDFMMEIPPLRRPTLVNIVTKTMARLEWYLKEVVPLFVLGTLILFTLDKLKWLPAIERWTNPLVTGLLELPPEATEAFIIGFLRRDYGATKFFDMYSHGELTVIQTTVALIVMTLFVPCLANSLMIIKERGLKTATAIVAFIYPFAFLVGGIVNWGLRL